MTNHSSRISAQSPLPPFDMTAFTGRAFDIASTLETLCVAMPDDKLGDPVPATYMVGMLAERARALANDLAELPRELVRRIDHGGGS